jgi:hypothetical protein
LPQTPEPPPDTSQYIPSKNLRVGIGDITLHYELQPRNSCATYDLREVLHFDFEETEMAKAKVAKKATKKATPKRTAKPVRKTAKRTVRTSTRKAA